MFWGILAKMEISQKISGITATKVDVQPAGKSLHNTVHWDICFLAISVKKTTLLIKEIIAKLPIEKYNGCKEFINKCPFNTKNILMLNHRSESALKLGRLMRHVEHGWNLATLFQWSLSVWEPVDLNGKQVNSGGKSKACHCGTSGTCSVGCCLILSFSYGNKKEFADCIPTPGASPKPCPCTLVKAHCLTLSWPPPQATAFQSTQWKQSSPSFRDLVWFWKIWCRSENRRK